jgi:hypothetical protein
MEVHCIYKYEYSIMDAPNTKKGKGSGNMVEEVNLFEVHCMHIWNDHNEMPSSY